MVLACVAMLLFPSFWEGRGQQDAVDAGAGNQTPAVFPGGSTLRPEDLVPAWRGPTRSVNQDG